MFKTTSQLSLMILRMILLNHAIFIILDNHCRFHVISRYATTNCFCRFWEYPTTTTRENKNTLNYHVYTYMYCICCNSCTVQHLPYNVKPCKFIITRVGTTIKPLLSIPDSSYNVPTLSAGSSGCQKMLVVVAGQWLMRGLMTWFIVNHT